MAVQELRSSFIGLPKMSAPKSVRRCLFGIPDHEQLRKDLDAQLKNTNTEISQTWNFDFDLDKPSTGRYEWCRIDSEEYVPEFYRKGYKPTKFRARRPCVDRDNLQTLDLTPPSSPTPVAAVSRLSAETDSDIEAEAKELQRENETTPEFRPRREKQSRIEDFMKVKKRRLSVSDDDLGSEDLPPSKSARR